MEETDARLEAAVALSDLLRRDLHLFCEPPVAERDRDARLREDVAQLAGA